MPRECKLRDIFCKFSWNALPRPRAFLIAIGLVATLEALAYCGLHFASFHIFDHYNIYNGRPTEFILCSIVMIVFHIITPFCIWCQWILIPWIAAYPTLGICSLILGRVPEGVIPRLILDMKLGEPKDIVWSLTVSNQVPEVFPMLTLDVTWIDPQAVLWFLSGYNLLAVLIAYLVVWCFTNRTGAGSNPMQSSIEDRLFPPRGVRSYSPNSRAYSRDADRHDPPRGFGSYSPYSRDYSRDADRLDPPWGFRSYSPYSRDYSRDADRLDPPRGYRSYRF